MELKCIGGERDGYLAYVPDGFKTGDQIRVPKKRDFDIFAVPPVDVIPSMISEAYCYYRVSSIHGASVNGDRVKLLYLCPSDWHEWEAIMHQFKK